MKIPKFHKPQLNRRTQITIGVVVLIAGLAIGAWMLPDKNPTPQDKIVFQSQTQQKAPEGERLVKVPEGAKSSTCDAISKSAIEQSTKQTVAAKNIMFADTQTEEGSFAGCSYELKEGGTLRSVSILVRTFINAPDAASTYATLTRQGGEVIQASLPTYFMKDSGLIIIHDGDELITVTLSRSSSDGQLESTLIQSLSALFE